MKVQIVHAYFSFTKDNYQGHDFYALKKVSFPPKYDDRKDKAKVQVVSVSIKDLAEFKSFLADIIKGVA